MKKTQCRMVVMIFLLAIQHPALSQEDISKAVRANNMMFRFSQVGGMMKVGDIIQGMPSSDAPEVLGDTYWDKHWAKSSLLLYKNDGLIEGFMTRYDIHKDEFEFLVQNDVKILKGTAVKNIVWLDSLTSLPRFMINAKGYTEEKVPLAGFIEVLVEGTTMLVKKVKLEVLKPDFNPALNVGSKDARILKKEFYYFNNGKELIRVKSKKSIEPLYTLYNNDSKRVEAYIKKEGIKFNNENDLVKLFSYLTASKSTEF